MIALAVRGISFVWIGGMLDIYTADSVIKILVSSLSRFWFCFLISFLKIIYCSK
jgi:hypothetical protein